MSIALMWRQGVAEGRPEEVLASRIAHRGERRPHVCFVAPHAWPVFSGDPAIPMVGGAEVQQSILARLLARNGYRVSMICLDYGQPDAAQVDGVTVYKSYRPAAGIPVLRFLHPRLTTTWRALLEVDADIYYQRSSAMLTGVVAQFCRRHGKRSIYAGASDMDFVPANQQIRFARDRWLFRRGVRMVDRIVVQNRTQLETCRAHFGREAVLIPSCYEPPRDSRPRAGDCVLWVGTVTRYKRPEILLELARRLPRRRFVIVGGPAFGEDPAYCDGIRQAAAALPNVEMTGFLPLAQAEPWFDRARVVMNTSDFEGMPNTFLQAWSRGVPTLATVDVGTPVNTVFSTTDQAAAHIERLFCDQPYWQAAAARCREHFRATHSPDEVLARYRQLFDELARK
jgi:glycosyltransferase involved in cell wall biosynthesis